MSDENDGVDWNRLEQDATGVDPEKPHVEVHVLSSDMLARRLIWDIVPCSEAVRAAKILNLPATSEDVDEMEHLEAHGRLNGVLLVAPIIEQMATHAAGALVAATVAAQQEASGVEFDLSEEDRQETVDKMEVLVFQTSVAILAELVDLGLVHLPHLFPEPRISL